LPDFAHIAMVHSGHLTIVPSDRDGIPARFCDTAAVGGIALPINPAFVIDFSLFCLRIVRRAVNLSYAAGFALRGFFLSLALFFFAAGLRCAVAIVALHPVIRLESHGVPFRN